MVGAIVIATKEPLPLLVTLALTKDDLVRRLLERRALAEKFSKHSLSDVNEGFGEVVSLAMGWDGRGQKVFALVLMPDTALLLAEDPFFDGFDGSEEHCAEVTRRANEAEGKR